MPILAAAERNIGMASITPTNMGDCGYVGILVAGCLGLALLLGFTMVATGLCRSKNAGHTFTMNLIALALGAVAFLAYGFAIAVGDYGTATAPATQPSTFITATTHSVEGASQLNAGLTINGWHIMGSKGFFLSGLTDASSAPTPLAMFFLLMVLSVFTAAIATGAMAERWSWKSFCLFSIWAVLPFALFANWIWGGGWLAQLGSKAGLGHGVVDLAGAGAVHGLGGIIALTGAWMLGPRIGKFINGRPQAIPGHHLPMVMMGTFVMLLGFLAITAGMGLLTATPSVRLDVMLINTLLAGSGGALSAMGIMWRKYHKPDPSLICNGLLGGLVAISAGSAFVSPFAALVIGGLAGLLTVAGVFFWDAMRIDDPVGAVSVHGLNGLWGLLAVGLFANGQAGNGLNGVAGPVRGMFYGDFGQLGAQALAVGVCATLGFTCAFGLFKLTNIIAPIRVDRESELQGLDVPEMGAVAYPDFELKTLHSVSEMAGSYYSE